MPLPFILAGAAVAAAGFGVKKGVDAKNDLNDADRYSRRAKRLANDFNEELEDQKSNTADALENYGVIKKNVIGSVVDFQALFDVSEESVIQNNFNESKRIVITKLEEVEILKEIGVLESQLSFTEAKNKVLSGNVVFSEISSGLQSAAAGSLAGIAASGGAYLGVGSLATASTGTAITGLSGVAATNATLAWLGGGSLASGGLGMAGGTLVLGGLVAGPLLAIGGSVFASKAAEKLDEARAVYSETAAEVEKGKVVVSKLNAIEEHTLLCSSVCSVLQEQFTVIVDILSEYAQRNMHYRDMNMDEKEQVKLSYKMAYLLKDFVNLGTINDEGNDVNPKSVELVERASL